MSQIITRDAMETDMLDLVARVSSCGLGGWHVGQGADERAVAELRRGGHEVVGYDRNTYTNTLLRKAGVRSVLYDHRGHGRSAWGPAENATIEQLARDEAAARAVLG